MPPIVDPIHAILAEVERNADRLGREEEVLVPPEIPGPLERAPVRRWPDAERADEIRVTARYAARVRFSFPDRESVKIEVGEGPGQLFRAEDMLEFALWLLREAKQLRGV